MKARTGLYICRRRGDHIARDCKVKIECFECNARHHKALCTKLRKSLEKKKDNDKEVGVLRGR